MKLVLVVGPPRSGTSVTARILHERLGVCMGHNLVPGNKGNPKGFYEDHDIVQALRTRNFQTVWDAIYKTHSPREKLIGVKSPELAFIDMGRLRPDLVIWTHRGIVHNAGSLMVWQRPRIDYEGARRMVEIYHDAIARNIQMCDNVYSIDLTHQREEDDIEEELRAACSPVVLAASTRGS